MIRDIKLEIPWTKTVTIRQPQLIAYAEVRDLRTSFPEGAEHKVRSSWRDWSRNVAGEGGNYKLLLDFAQKHPVYEISFPTVIWNDLIYRKSEFLSNPANKVALYFIGSKGFNDVTGHPAGTEMFMIEDNLYRKITWRSLGLKNMRSAVRYEENGRLISFLHKCNKINKEPLRSQIIDGIGQELVRRDEEAAKKKIEASE